MPEIKCGFDDAPNGAKGWETLINYGPTLYVNIGFDSTWKPTDTKVPAAKVFGIGALVDTGATTSCIDDSLAKQLNLPIIDQAQWEVLGVRF